MPRRRKRGRPATGHDPILGVRVPAKLIRNIDRIAEVLSTDRSTVVRDWLQEGWGREKWRLRTGKGRGRTGEYIAVLAATERAKGAEAAVARAKPHEKIPAEIKALRAAEEADSREAALDQRIALQRANKMPAPRPRDGSHIPASKPGRARRLSADEVKARADRAEARSRS